MSASHDATASVLGFTSAPIPADCPLPVLQGRASTVPTATHFHAGYNDPGYLPESEPATFATFADAKAWLIETLNWHADNVGTWADEHDCDDLPCPTYGDDCPHDKANSLSLAAENLNLCNGPEWGDTVAGVAYWILPYTCDECDGQCDYDADTHDDDEEANDEPPALVVTDPWGLVRRHVLASFARTVDDAAEHMRHAQERLEASQARLERARALDEGSATHRPQPWPKTPSMSRGHFNYLARALLAAWPNDGRTYSREFVMGTLATHLADTCARFDRERFLRAASG